MKADKGQSKLRFKITFLKGDLDTSQRTVSLIKSKP